MRRMEELVEALLKRLRGRRIKHRDWEEEKYIYIDDFGGIYDQDGISCNLPSVLAAIADGNWEIYKSRQGELIDEVCRTLKTGIVLLREVAELEKEEIETWRSLNDIRTCLSRCKADLEDIGVKIEAREIKKLRGK